MDAPVFEATATVTNRRSPVIWSFVTAALLAPLLYRWLHPIFGLLGVFLVLVAAGSAGVFAYSIAAAVGRKRRKPALVRAEKGVLRFDGARRFRRIDTAYLQPRDGNLSTVFVSGGLLDWTEVLLDDDGKARDLLLALGVDPARSIARFRVHDGLFANKSAQTVLTAILGVGAYNAFNILPHAWRFPGFFALMLLSLLNWAPSTVAVGPDGVLVTSATRLRRKFHPFADIADATVTSWGVTLEMKSGRSIELRTETSAKSKSESRDALAARIRAGIAALDPTGAADVASLVARAGRPVEEWLRALDAVTGPAAGYRVATVPADKLWRVVEDPTADPSARAGAAAALRASLDDEGRARLAAIADASVHPKVRVALDAIASSKAADDDERLREALEGCAEDQASRRALSE